MTTMGELFQYQQIAEPPAAADGAAQYLPGAEVLERKFDPVRYRPKAAMWLAEPGQPFPWKEIADPPPPPPTPVAGQFPFEDWPARAAAARRLRLRQQLWPAQVLAELDAGLPETIQTSDWFVPLAVPFRPARRPEAIDRPDLAVLDPTYAALPETITIDKWYRPLAIPFRPARRPEAIDRPDLAVLDPTYAALPETITIDKWEEHPWDVRYRVKPRPTPWGPEGDRVLLEQLFPDDPITYLELPWWTPFSQPRYLQYRTFAAAVRPFAVLDPTYVGLSEEAHVASFSFPLSRLGPRFFYRPRHVYPFAVLDTSYAAQPEEPHSAAFTVPFQRPRFVPRPYLVAHKFAALDLIDWSETVTSDEWYVALSVPHRPVRHGDRFLGLVTPIFPDTTFTVPPILLLLSPMLSGGIGGTF